MSHARINDWTKKNNFRCAVVAIFAKESAETAFVVIGSCVRGNVTTFHAETQDGSDARRPKKCSGLALPVREFND
jgi:hypothetical protein